MRSPLICSKTMYRILLLHLLHLYTVSLAIEFGPLVTTPLGKIQGTKLVSRDGHKYHAFNSIPYAKPPIGALRLKSPQPVEPWEGVLNGTVIPIHCIQSPIYMWHMRNRTSGSENCLFLNIFSPELKPKNLNPVMVYIHGGGLRCGAPPSRPADFLIDENVVLVTIQYRLGPLGFLSMEDSTIPGNFGLKDQAMALKWISQYISNFGGDPKQLTIFGESAGGISTHLLMKSSLSKDLIKGSISQSGTFLIPFGINKPGEAKKIAEKIAHAVGCPSRTSKEALACLQQVDPVNITRTDLDFLVFDFHPIMTCSVVAEEPGPNAFITKNELFSDTDLPWIAGMDTREGAMIAGSLRGQKEKYNFDFLRNNLDMVISSIAGLSNETDTGKAALITIKNQFFQYCNNYNEILSNIEEFCSAIFFTCPLYKVLSSSKGPTYLYLNNYRAGSSEIDSFDHQDADSGASHADENLLLLNQRDVFTKVKPNEDAASKALVRLWANFAKFQNPSPNNQSKIWWPVSEKPKEYVFLLFNESPSLETNYKMNLMEFCNSLPHFS